MFKIYKNKKVRHPSISLKSKDKKKWYNLPISHEKAKNDSNMEIDDPSQNIRTVKVYVRKYVRKDKKGVKGHRYIKYRLNNESELLIKNYLKEKYKKR